jgi:hypothetical protein
LNETGTTNVNKVVQLFAARPLLRYPLVLLVYALACGLAQVLAAILGASFNAGSAFVVLFPAWTVAWIVLAVRDRRRMIWRLLLIWVPAILTTAISVALVSAAENSDPGIAFYMMLWPEFGILLACLVGSIAALVYRPGEGPLRPTQ